MLIMIVSFIFRTKIWCIGSNIYNLFKCIESLHIGRLKFTKTKIGKDFSYEKINEWRWSRHLFIYFILFMIYSMLTKKKSNI